MRHAFCGDTLLRFLELFSVRILGAVKHDRCMRHASLRVWLSALATCACVLASSQIEQAPRIKQGPLVGHVTDSTARIWVRVDTEGDFVLAAQSTDAPQRTITAKASATSDQNCCITFALAALRPGQRYHYAIHTAVGSQICAGKDYTFATAPTPDADGSVRLMFGSCAHENEGTAKTWRRVQQENPDVVVLLGDTPYIDNTSLGHQRRRYAAFAEFAPMAELLRTTPWYGTWDDHDFGSNDIDGRLKGQENSRRAFVEFHANPSYGDGERGIYTSFRRGPIEVFLLDTRTFAATEPSPFLRHHASLLGAKQWQWLHKQLRASTAPVKVLACGMIWNGAVRPGKLDHWGSYPHERSALFDWIGKHKVSGVVLVGGDIHRSRVVRHASKARAGYDIMELITSPMHHSIIRAANAPHPGLVKDMGEPFSFLMLEAAQAQQEATSARARFVNAEGRELFALDLLQ